MRLRSKRSGFSLIEAAIVLGIVGLVIGGIWIAASAVMEQKKYTDYLALFAVGLETAQLYKKNIQNGDLGPLIQTRSIPGGFTADPDTWPGLVMFKRDGMYATFQMDERRPRISVTFRSPTDYNVTRAQPKLCTRIATFLLMRKDTQYGTINDGSSFVSIPTTVNAIADICDTAGSMTVILAY